MFVCGYATHRSGRVVEVIGRCPAPCVRPLLETVLLLVVRPVDPKREKGVHILTA